MSDEPKKQYTPEEKIESLVSLAKAVGRYINAEAGTDYYRDAYLGMRDAYDAFCDWRHDDPYVGDEVAAMWAIIQDVAIEPPTFWDDINGQMECVYCDGNPDPHQLGHIKHEDYCIATKAGKMVSERAGSGE